MGNLVAPHMRTNPLENGTVGKVIVYIEKVILESRMPSFLADGQ